MNTQLLTTGQSPTPNALSVVPSVNTNLAVQQAAPSGFFMRVRNLFAAQRKVSTSTPKPANNLMQLDGEDLFEYHNPTLGLEAYGFGSQH